MPERNAPFKYFNRNARRVMSLAHEEALRLNHTYVGTEHLLLGLVRVEKGSAVQILRKLGVEPKHVIGAVERRVGRGERPPSGKPKLAPRVRRVIEHAFTQAQSLNHSRIRVAHLLLGLIFEDDSEGIQALKHDLNVKIDELEAQTKAVLAQTKTRRTANRAKSTTSFWNGSKAKDKDSKTPLTDQLDFNENARRVMFLAQEETLRLHHTYVGTEHFLLGLVRVEKGSAVQILRKLGVEPRHVIGAVKRRVGRGERPPSSPPKLAPRVRRVIEHAFTQAQSLNHSRIRVAHLLLGFILEDDSVGIRVLKYDLNVKIDELEAQTKAVLAQTPNAVAGQRQGQQDPADGPVGLRSDGGGNGSAKRAGTGS